MQGSGCGGLSEIEGQLLLKQRRWRGEEKGERGGEGEEGDKCVTRGRRAGTLTTRLVRCKDGMLRQKKSFS